MQPSTPEAIGRYRILRPLGSGAMGDVFLAIDPHIDRQLAIKTVRVVGGSAKDVAVRSDRLLREARAAGKLLHPNVVALFDADRAEGILYLAFEYVPGTDLAQRASSEPPLTLREVLDIGRQVADALDYAHQHGIVHRDIKPSNILLSEHGRAKVADFGIAKLHGSTELTRTGSVVGSPQYMSPEQVRGEPLDGRSDLFSLGVMLYELLCRLRPFGGDTLSTLVFEILSKEPPTVDQLRPGLPAELVALVHRLLAKERDHRSANAAQVASDLQSILQATSAGLLDAPAAGDAHPSERTVRMASSADVPPPPLGQTPSQPFTSTPPLVPPPAASTLDASGPARIAGVPPTLPPLPPRVEPRTTVTGTQPPAATRQAPFDTATHTPAGGGKRLWLALAILIPLALVSGLFLARLLPESDGQDSPPQVAMSDVADSDAESPEAVDGEVVEAEDGAIRSEPDRTAVTRVDESDDPTRSPGQDASPPTAQESVETPIDRADAGSDRAAAPRPATETPEVTPPPRDTAATPPSASTPAPPTRSQPATSAPPSDATAVTSSPSASSSPPAIEPANPRLAEFDAAAAAADRELSTGRRLRFAVRPDDAVVKIQARGERSIVQGRVSDFEDGKDDARDLELPIDGEFLVTLVHPAFPDVVLRVDAAASRGTTPHVVRLALAAASRRAGGGGVRVTHGLSFEVTPADAMVWVDGREVGPASQWPGGRGLRSKNLKLDRGTHVIRLEAPGYEPAERRVTVVPRAGERIHHVVYELKRE